METGSVAAYGQLEFSFRWEWWGGRVDRGGQEEDLVCSFYFFLFLNWELSRKTQLCPPECGRRERCVGGRGGRAAARGRGRARLGNEAAGKEQGLRQHTGTWKRDGTHRGIFGVQK